MRRPAVIIILGLVFLASSIPAMAEEEEANDAPVPPSSELYFAPEEPPAWTLTRPVPLQWTYGSFYWTHPHREWTSGAHSFELESSATNWMQDPGFGDAVPVGFLQTSFTYRYRGLFGGIVRPVARFTVGAGQWYGALGLPSLNGYDSAWTAFAAPEAGLEFVVRGYGVGATASYVWTMNLMAGGYDLHDDLTGGPPIEESATDFLRNLRYNVYLIRE